MDEQFYLEPPMMNFDGSKAILSMTWQPEVVMPLECMPLFYLFSLLISFILSNRYTHIVHA
jgi:hypothetical protein